MNAVVRKALAEFLAGVDDLDAAARAVEREREIRLGMIRTGEGREVVAEFLDAQAAMTDEIVLELTDGEPTTLADALRRYAEKVMEEGVPVGAEYDLAAIVDFPWSQEEKTIQLHNPHYGLALHITHPEKDRTEIRMGSNRWLVADVRHEGYGMEGMVEDVARSVHRAVLARVIPDREHIVKLNPAETAQLRRCLNGEERTGSLGDRLTVEPSGGGVWIRTRPYGFQHVSKNLDT